MGVYMKVWSNRVLNEVNFERYIGEDGKLNFNTNKQIIDFNFLSRTPKLVITKESSLGKLYFTECSRQEAKEIIEYGHYSHKFINSFGKINIGVYKDGRLLGVASFGSLSKDSASKLSCTLQKYEVVELNRLWIADELGRNAETMLLGASWKIIRNCYPEIKLIQSFADGRVGCGTIYKASNFKYYGKTTTDFLRDVETQEIYHSRSLTDVQNIGTFMSLIKMYCSDKLELMTVNTYRYVMPLYKNVHCDLKEENYPEYDKGCVVNKYTNIRLIILIKALLISVDNKKYRKLKPEILNKLMEYNIEDIKSAFEKAQIGNMELVLKRKYEYNDLKVALELVDDLSQLN